MKIDSGLQRDINAYTHKSGRENTSWTPETVNQKLELIFKKSGVEEARSLQFAFFSIYRHASEIAHGTYFGALYALGRTQYSMEISNEEEFMKMQRGHLNALTLMLGGAVSATIKVLSTEIDDLEKIATAADNAIYGLNFLVLKLCLMKMK